jgi:polar amino acid transport system permease protein
VLASLFFDRPEARSPWWARAGMAALLVAGLAAACWGLLAGSVSNWEAVWRYRDVFWKGWLLTIGLSLAALALSSALGLVVALARRATFLPLRSAALVYIEALRGSPLLVQILFFWYVVAARFEISDRLLVGVLVLSAFSSAYLAEMIRAGIGSVSASQLESARAIGLSRWQTYRFVVFPQALRHVLPPLAGQFASLIKDSSLLSIIGLEELTFRAQQVNSATYSTLESFLPLALGYLLLTLPISALSRALERRFHYEN